MSDKTKRGLRAWDEIRRLEAENADTRTAHEVIVDDLRAENERLRADNARLRRLISAASDVLGGWDTEAGR